MAEQQGSLQLSTDDRFQRAEWFAQRVGWALWIAVIIAAGLGLLGPGWLSDRRLTAADGALTLDYERFVHYHNPSQLEVTFEGAPNAANQWTLLLGKPLLDRMQILRIEPEPVHQEVRANGASYTFAATADAAGGRVVFHVEYQRYGEVKGSVALREGTPLRFSQFVYP